MDSIADLITRIKNAGHAGQTTLAVRRTKMLADIAGVLEREGYIASVEEKEIQGRPHLVLGVKYREDGRPAIQGAERVSKLSRRVYSGARGIEPVRHGYGTVIITTPEGIVTGDEAKEKNVGGEVLFKIW